LFKKTNSNILTGYQYIQIALSVSCRIWYGKEGEREKERERKRGRERERQ